MNATMTLSPIYAAIQNALNRCASLFTRCLNVICDKTPLQPGCIYECKPV